MSHHTFLRSILILSSNICVCGSPQLSLPCRLSEYFTFSLKYILHWQQNFKHFTLQTHKSNEWEAVLWKNSMNTAVTLSINLWSLKWLTALLFAVCNGLSVTFEHSTPNCYNIHVHCTNSEHFIFYDLPYILMSL